MIIVVIISIIFVSILAMLLLPVTIYVNSIRSEGKIDGSVSISWIMFLLRYPVKDRQIEILAFGRRIVPMPRKEKPLKQEGIKKIKKTKKTPPTGNIFSMIGPMLRLLKDLVYKIRIKYLDIDITFGLNDPAYTGMLTGFFHAFQGSSRIGKNVRWTPDFTGQVLEWNMKAKASVTPVRLLPPMARFVTNRQVLRSCKTFIMNANNR